MCCSTSAQTHMGNMGNMDLFALMLFIYSPIIGLMLLPPLVFIALRGRIPKPKWFVILFATYLASAALASLASMFFSSMRRACGYCSHGS